MKQICQDLEAQYQEFDDLVKGLDEHQWHRNTPFFEWTIFDEVAHIVFFDHEALLAIEDLDQFNERALLCHSTSHGNLGPFPGCL